jgi:hypothetical protein
MVWLYGVSTVPFGIVGGVVPLMGIARLGLIVTAKEALCAESVTDVALTVTCSAVVILAVGEL